MNRKDNDIRLNVFVARATGLSRRAADEAIFSGKVKIDGEFVKIPGKRVNRNYKITFDGKRIRLPQKPTWIVLNKPKGYITTRSDEHGRPTVMDILPRKLRRLFHVGRLDSDAGGVLLFTDDGVLGEKLLHPKYGVIREYEVEIFGKLNGSKLKVAKRGVIIDGKRAVPVEIEKVGENGATQLWRLKLTEGRYHEVKRFFEALGLEVVSLKRLSFAGMSIEGLKSGEWRELTENEIAELKSKYG